MNLLEISVRGELVEPMQHFCKSLRIDYRALTADHFATCTQSDEIRKVVDRNRTVLADIAANASRTIAHQARVDSLSYLLGGSIDLHA